jgi:hypothetical protein
MKCALCNADQSKTVTLWDGKNYCAECTGSVHKDLYDYAQYHETLSSSYRQFFSVRQVIFSSKIHVASIVLVLGVFFAVVYFAPAKEPFEWGGVILLFLFFSIVLFTFAPANILYPIWREIWQHPHMDIAGGKVTLTIRKYGALIPYGIKKKIVLPLSSVQLQMLPLSKDMYFPLIMISNKERYSLLDFSECVDDVFFNIASNMLPVGLSHIEKRRWRESPYLCFTASPFENEILKAFFDLLAKNST